MKSNDVEYDHIKETAYDREDWMPGLAFNHGERASLAQFRNG